MMVQLLQPTMEQDHWEFISRSGIPGNFENSIFARATLC